MSIDEKQTRKESSAARGYELSGGEKRDLIALIQAGKPLPEKYRFLLFADKREVELVWNGKTRDVCTTILPFQTLEHIDEPRKEKHEENQLVGFDAHGRQAKGWTNKLIWGENKLILSSLKSGALRRQGSNHRSRRHGRTTPCRTTFFAFHRCSSVFIGGKTSFPCRDGAKMKRVRTLTPPSFLYHRLSPAKKSFQPVINGDER